MAGLSDPFAQQAFALEPTDVSFTRIGGPIHIPSLTEQEMAALLAELHPWVEALRTRFLVDQRAVPVCWERHPGMVEALTALRDAERGAYAESAPANAAVDFLHAVHLVTNLLREQAGLSGCSGHTHREPLAPLV